MVHTIYGAELLTIAGRQKWEDQQITCTSIGSTGNLLIFTFLVASYSAWFSIKRPVNCTAFVVFCPKMSSKPWIIYTTAIDKLCQAYRVYLMGHSSPLWTSYLRHSFLFIIRRKILFESTTVSNHFNVALSVCTLWLMKLSFHERHKNRLRYPEILSALIQMFVFTKYCNYLR